MIFVGADNNFPVVFHRRHGKRHRVRRLLVVTCSSHVPAARLRIAPAGAERAPALTSAMRVRENVRAGADCLLSLWGSQSYCPSRRHDRRSRKRHRQGVAQEGSGR